MSLITYAASFDGNDLTTVPGLTVLATNPYAAPKRNLNFIPLARVSKAKVNSAFYKQRTITVRVGITRATRDLMETSLDILYGYLQGIEKRLILRQAGNSRLYTTTYSDTVIKVEGGSYLEMDLIFEASDFFGYDTAPTLLLQVSNFTSGSKTDQITVGGSALWQQPTITISFSAITGSSTRAVTVGNGSNGQAITVSRTWAAGDVLVIDASGSTPSVKVNGVETAFTGAIPEWQIGTGYLTYSDTFSARTMSNRTIYTKRYT